MIRMMMTMKWLLSLMMMNRKATPVRAIQRWLGITATRRKSLTTSPSQRRAPMCQCPRTPAMTRGKKAQKTRNPSGPPYPLLLDVNSGITIRLMEAPWPAGVTAIETHVRGTRTRAIQMDRPDLPLIMLSLLRILMILMTTSQFHRRGGPEPRDVTEAETTGPGIMEPGTVETGATMADGGDIRARVWRSPGDVYRLWEAIPL